MRKGVISLFRNINQIQKWTNSHSVQITVLGLEYLQLKMILVALLLDSLSTAQQQQVYFPTLNKDPITKIVTIVTLVEKHQCPYF